MQPSRPLNIENAGPQIVRSSIQGPQFFASNLFMGFDDYYHPRIHQFREKYDFLQAIADEPSEFRRQLLLRNWVSSQWPVDNDQRFGGDAFAILDYARASGEGFHCSHCMTVQQAVMVCCGFVCRQLGVDRDSKQFGRSYHHGVNEVWSNEHAKWVMLDAKYDNHFERDGVPLSAIEVHEEVRRDGGKHVQMVIGPDRVPTPNTPKDQQGPRYDSYWWVSFHLRQNTFTQPHFADRSALVIYDNDAFRNDTWYRGGKPCWAYEANAFIPAERSQIEWTPGVVALERIGQIEPGQLRVAPRSATPNIKEYRYRINGGAWQSTGFKPFKWDLRDGRNTLEIRSCNLFGVEGPTTTATVEYQAG